jgi:MFS family permease
VTDTEAAIGSWRELLSAKYLGTSVVLAGGVALYAINEFLTTSLLPSTVAEIGGSRLYAWVTTLYLVGSVVAATMVSPMLSRLGPRSSYLLGAAVFGVASLLCGMAPSMEFLIAGRALQGVAGGLLAGLGYAIINTALPRSLWARGSALVSAMWGVATVVGPATGGLFAQFGLWRWAFVAMVVLTALIALLVPIALPVGRADPGGAPPGLKVPVWSLLLLGAAALAVSVAQLPRSVVATAGLLAAAIVLVAVFLVVDRRARAAVLPSSVFSPGPSKWIYLTMAVLMVGAMVSTYVPLFGQRLAHLSPVAAGFLGAALAIGWTAGEIVSASLQSRRVIDRLIVAAPVVMTAGLALDAVTLRGNASIGIVGLWSLGLLVAGTGIGIAWPHLSARAMDAGDPAEGSAAAAAINTAQLISSAFGAGLAGVVVNALGDFGDVVAARWLFTVFTVVGTFGVVAARGATRGARPHDNV